MHKQDRVVFFTEEQLQTNADILDHAKSDGLKVVVVTEQQQDKLEAQAAAGGPQVRTLATYVQEYNASFQYKFIDLRNLTKEERGIYDLTPKIFESVITGYLGQTSVVAINQSATSAGSTRYSTR
ncbi:MAG: hypothetical protein HY646_10460 [Acidobacteria bacterium]|nr:hypothetical protein [Acidobacteriota bacterium]